MRLYEQTIKLEVSKEDWDKLDEAALDEITDTIDMVICEAMDNITDLISDLSAEKNIKINVLSD